MNDRVDIQSQGMPLYLRFGKTLNQCPLSPVGGRLWGGGKREGRVQYSAVLDPEGLNMMF